VKAAAALLVLVGGLALLAGPAHAQARLAAGALPPVVDVDLKVGELQRSFHYAVLPGLAPGAPVVFVLHGSGGDGLGIRNYTGKRFDQLALENGFVVVYPDGYEKHWNDCRGSAGYAANTKNIDDPAFFRAMIDELVRRQEIDRSRVFVAGFSNGAQMAYRLALETPELFRGVAAIAASLPVDENNDCQVSGKPVSMLVINGTDDTINPFVGGPVVVNGDTSRGSVQSTYGTAAYFRGLAGLDGPPETRRFADTDPNDGSVAVLATWEGAHEVSVLTLIGGGHAVPGPATMPPASGNGLNRDIDGPAEIWAFFERQSERESATPRPEGGQQP